MTDCKGRTGQKKAIPTPSNFPNREAGAHGCRCETEADPVIGPGRGSGSGSVRRWSVTPCKMDACIS